MTDFYFQKYILIKISMLEWLQANYTQLYTGIKNNLVVYNKRYKNVKTLNPVIPLVV